MRRLSYANVTSTLALCIAMGGTAVAAGVLPSNSVGTAQLKAGAVTKAKLARGVTISGPRGPVGRTGTAGASGPSGAAGPAGISGFEVVATNPDNPLLKSAEAVCPAGKRVIGGGAAVVGVTGGSLIHSLPDLTSAQQGWIGAVTVSSPSYVAVWAFCAVVS